MRVIKAATELFYCIRGVWEVWRFRRRLKKAMIETKLRHAYGERPTLH